MLNGLAYLFYLFPRPKITDRVFQGSTDAPKLALAGGCPCVWTNVIHGVFNIHVHHFVEPRVVVARDGKEHCFEDSEIEAEPCLQE